MKIKLTKGMRKILRGTLSFRRRLKIYWRLECLSLALSSSYNRIRDKISEQTALEFNNYLGRLDVEEKERVISKLKLNLNQESRDEVDRFLERQEYIHTHNILIQKEIFTDEEFKEQELASQESKKFEKKLKKFNLKHYTVESLFAHNGLRWMGEEQKQKLQGGIFLDIGALDGDSALAFYYNYNAKTIYSFEPEKHNFKKLEHTANTLGNDIIIPIKKAISNKNFTTKIDRRGGSSRLDEKSGQEDVGVTTIDDIVKLRNIKKVDLIKLDIEGEEMNALLGAQETIKRDKPILLISIYHNPHDFFEIKPYLEQLFPEYKYTIKKTNPFSLNHEIMLFAYI